MEDEMDTKTRKLVEWFDAQFKRLGVDNVVFVHAIDIVAGSVEIDYGDARWTLAINDAQHTLLGLSDDADETVFVATMDAAI